MSDLLKPYWCTMSASRLISHLRHMSYPEPHIRTVLEAHREYKAARRAQKIKNTMTHQLWALILQAARTELGVVRTMKSQLRRDLYPSAAVEAKLGALGAYEGVLVGVIAKLRAVQEVDEMTPAQFVAHLHREGKRQIPNGGTHWTDYVKPADRRRIEAMFDSLPHTGRGKKKVPFERRISTEEHDKLRVKLLHTLSNDLAKAEQELSMVGNSFDRDDLQAKISRMQEAQFILDGLPNNAPLPQTWYGLLNMRDQIV